MSLYFSSTFCFFFTIDIIKSVVTWLPEFRYAWLTSSGLVKLIFPGLAQEYSCFALLCVGHRQVCKESNVVSWYAYHYEYDSICHTSMSVNGTQILKIRTSLRRKDHRSSHCELCITHLYCAFSHTCFTVFWAVGKHKTFWQASMTFRGEIDDVELPAPTSTSCLLEVKEFFMCDQCQSWHENKLNVRLCV